MNKEYVQEIEKKHNVKIVYVTYSGSKLYGTDTPESDTDYKGLFIPNEIDVLLKRDAEHITLSKGNGDKQKNTAEDVDADLYSVYKFFNLLQKSETGAVDILFSMFREDTIVYEDKTFTDVIKSNKDKFMNKNMKAFIGYALGQSKKFGIKGDRYNDLDKFVKFMMIGMQGIPSDTLLGNYFEYIKKEVKGMKYINFIMAPGPRGSGDYSEIEYISVLGKMFEGRISVGYFMERVTKLYDQFGNRTKATAETESKTDYKALSHALRIALEVEELLKTGFIKFPLKDAEFLREIKQGKHNTEDIINLVEETLSRVDVLLLDSDLPEKSDTKFIDGLLLQLVKE